MVWGYRERRSDAIISRSLEKGRLSLPFFINNQYFSSSFTMALFVSILFKTLMQIGIDASSINEITALGEKISSSLFNSDICTPALTKISCMGNIPS